MKTLVIFFCSIFVGITTSFCQLDSIYVEIIEHDESIPILEGQTTYRIYARLANPDDRVLSLSGDDLCPLDISTNSTFFRSDVHSSAYLQSLSLLLISFFEDAFFSSGITIGFLNDSSFGAPLDESVGGVYTIEENIINNVGLEDVNDPWDLAFVDGENLIMDGLGGESIFDPSFIVGLGYGQHNSVLIGQFTTDGQLTFNLNIDVNSPENGQDVVYQYKWCEGLVPSLSFYCGCTEVLACNYNPEAIEDDGSCCYDNCGCVNPFAINYEEDVCFNDGSCEFNVSGIVFNDQNENGIQDENEISLASQEVTISPAGMVVLTNELGQFTAEIGEGEQFIQITPSGAFPFPTSQNPISINPLELESSEFSFGFNSSIPSYDLGVYLYPNGNTFLCDSDLEHYITFTNQGNATISGIVEFEYDPLFQGYSAITPLDSSNANVVYMSFENLIPGQTEIFSIDLITPTVDFIGEEITNSVSVTGFYNDEQVSFGQDSLTMEITCAYDPNDKQAFPLGYTEEHWLLPETEQEFLVRFQNTGNAPAQDVRIQDTIDVNYDLSTFRFVANSHSVMTTINEETRVIDFFFEDIQLPDSVNNEPESHGLISYAIAPYAGLEIGTELNNTAFIYFDNNEAIVTNTTWTTIHECGGEAAFEASTTTVCSGEEVSFTSTYEELEETQWNINSVAENTETSISKTFEEAGEYIVQLVAENPLCNASSMQMITVYETPTVEFTQEGDLLTASEGETYQWLLNGEEIEGATSQEHSVTEDGTYSVEVTNGEICTAESEGIMIVGISELDAETILLYPNPMSDRAYLEFEDSSSRTVRLVDATGKVVRVWNGVSTPRIEISRDELSAGSYVVSVEAENTQFLLKLILK